MTGRRRLGVALSAALAGALAAPEARAGDPDPWFGRDKALHFGASALIAGGGYAGAALVGGERSSRVATAASFALFAGVGKEVWDYSGRGDASVRDLTWDVVGTAVGVALSAALDWSLDWSRARWRAARGRAP